MRDIVATIQPEQDEIVRADADVSVCVQGAPGTGKTAVGLHRAAWLLYAYRSGSAGPACSSSAPTGRSSTT
jgi:DNA helicase IV